MQSYTNGTPTSVSRCYRAVILWGRSDHSRASCWCCGNCNGRAHTVTACDTPLRGWACPALKCLSQWHFQLKLTWAGWIHEGHNYFHVNEMQCRGSRQTCWRWRGSCTPFTDVACCSIPCRSSLGPCKLLMHVSGCFMLLVPWYSDFNLVRILYVVGNSNFKFSKDTTTYFLSTNIFVILYAKLLRSVSRC